MLVLSRKIGETIRVGDEVELVVLDVTRGRVKLGFAGSRDVSIRRGELVTEHLPEQIEPTVPEWTDSPCDRIAVAPLRAFRTAGA